MKSADRLATRSDSVSISCCLKNDIGVLLLLLLLLVMDRGVGGDIEVSTHVCEVRMAAADWGLESFVATRGDRAGRTADVYVFMC